MRGTQIFRNVYDPAFLRRLKRTVANYRDALDFRGTSPISREAFVDIDDKGVAWYLGHMRKGSKDLERKLQECSFILEIRDARLPFTTENPTIRSIAPELPRLIVFNKAELSNEDCNNAIQAYYESIGAYTLFTSAKRTWRDTVECIRRFAINVLPPKQHLTTSHIGVIVGMPNVGKSTFINSLRLSHDYLFYREDFRRSRTPETVAMEPGTTRNVKLIHVCKDPNVALYDTPGLTLPGCFSKEAGFKLAACGIIPVSNNALNAELVSRYLFDIFSASGSLEHLSECLFLPRTPITFDDCLCLIAERTWKRGAATELGNPLLANSAQILMLSFQEGKLGKMTLDRLPNKIKERLRGNAAERVEQLGSSASTSENLENSTNEFSVTHDVQLADAPPDCPPHMANMMRELQNGFTSVGVNNQEAGVISRLRGPIRRSYAAQDSSDEYFRLRPGR